MLECGLASTSAPLTCKVPYSVGRSPTTSRSITSNQPDTQNAALHNQFTKSRNALPAWRLFIFKRRMSWRARGGGRPKIARACEP